MKISISLNLEKLQKWQEKIAVLPWFSIVLWGSFLFSVWSIAYFFGHDQIIAYGDAESHLDIAKRVVSGLTPGFAQLGGIWLPLPHLLMVPFLFFEPLWRTGLGGSIVSGVCYIVSCLTLYKLTQLLTKNTLASLATWLVFALNPNVLYMQSTPMTELPLIAFSLLSTYYFIKYMHFEKNYLALIFAAFFGFCATLSRYDAWALVLLEAAVLVVKDIFHRKLWNKVQGRLVLFSTLAFLGIFLWLLWGYAILGDPLYFTHSQFSAKAQQSNWLAKNELPGYKNPLQSILYYSVTSMSNAGVLVFFMALFGLIFFLLNKQEKYRYYYVLLLFAPFLLNVATLFLGQSVIFIPDITPVSFEWRLFNVRYGVLMIPVFAFFLGYLFYKAPVKAKILITSLFLFQYVLFGIGYTRVITWADGTVGLSAAKRPNAEYWMAAHYDHGLVLLDDYARTMSIIRSNMPMQDVIYIGSKPYWDESLVHPEKYATWVVMQKNDSVWKHLYDNTVVRARLYKYFRKVYTSPEILIFKRA